MAKSKSASNWYDQYLIHAVNIAVYLIVVLIYFKPVLDDKSLKQQDIISGRGMSRELHDYREATGEEALWTNSMFGGMPGYQISTAYPGNLLQMVDSIVKLGLPHPMGIMLWLFLGFYILLVILKVDPWLCGIGAAGYALSSYFFIALEAGHHSKLNALGFIGPILGGIILCYEGRYLLGGALVALFFGLEVNANHPQMTFYFMIMLMVFFVARFIYEVFSKELSISIRAVGIILMLILAMDLFLSGKIRIFTGIALGVPFLVYCFRYIRPYFNANLMIGGAMVLAILPNISRMWTTYEYSLETIRGKNELLAANNGVTPAPAPAALLTTSPTQEDPEVGLKRDYAYQWSYGVGETFTLMVPYFHGGSSGDNIGINSRTAELIDQKYGQSILSNGKTPKETMTPGWPTYWGSQPFTSGPVYVGAIFCFLFVLGLILVEAKYKWWILAATLLFIMLSWGRNFQWFSDIFFDHFPMYNRFRSVSSMLVIAQFLIPLLGILAVNKALKAAPNSPQKKFRVQLATATGICIGILFFFWVAAPDFPGWFTTTNDAGLINNSLTTWARRMGADIKFSQQDISNFTDALHNDRISMFRSDILRAIGLILASGALVYVIWRFRKETYAKVAAAGLGLLVLLDMYPVCQRYLSEDNFVNKSEIEAEFTPSRSDLAVKSDKSYYRVLKLGGDPFQDAMTSYHHFSIGGYHPAKIRRYNDIITRVLEPDGKSKFADKGEINKLIGGLQSVSYQNPLAFKPVADVLAQANVMNMLNTKYIIYDPGRGVVFNPLDSIIGVIQGNKQMLIFRPADGDINNTKNWKQVNDAGTVMNPYACGNAWFVSEVKTVNTPVEEINSLYEINPKVTAVVGKDFAKSVAGFKPDISKAVNVSLTEYKPNKLTYSYEAGSEQLIVFSEIYYNDHKGWKAYIDGKETPHFRVNYVLRALRVPGGTGKHTIEFKFEPRSFYTGNKISLVFSLLLLGFVGFAAYKEVKGRMNKAG